MIVLTEGQHFRVICADDEPGPDGAETFIRAQPFNPWVEEILESDMPHVLQLEDGRMMHPARREPCGHA